MTRANAFSLAVLASIFLSVSAQAAEVPHYVNFQSVLRDDGGNIITDDFIDLQIKILDQDKDVVYEETQPGVQVVRGAVNVMIGEGLEPGSSPSAPTGGIPTDVLDPEKGSHFLQVQFGSNLPSDGMELGSVPYAMYAEVALGLASSTPPGSLPDYLVTQDELDGAIQAHENDTTAHPAGSITTVDEFDNSNGANVQDVLDDLDQAITDEEGARASADSGLQGQVDGKVNRSGDTMTAELSLPDQGSGPVLSGGNFNVGRALRSHENRISALEGASGPQSKTLSLAWQTDVNNASGGFLSGADASNWSLSGVNTADGKWVSVTRSSITVPSGCLAMASGTVSPIVSDGQVNSHDYDDPAFLKITYSGTGDRTMAFKVYGLGNDGEYDINIRIIAIPISPATSCLIP